MCAATFEPIYVLGLALARAGLMGFSFLNLIRITTYFQIPPSPNKVLVEVLVAAPQEKVANLIL